VGNYSVRIKASAAKELEELPAKTRARIAARIRALGDGPRPPGCEKLSERDLYRVRQGTYRILYAVRDPEWVVVVLKIGRRREVYR
jgi:mRNA interferase RelE/StbE